MPNYDLTCGHSNFMTFRSYDRVMEGSGRTTCPEGCVDPRPVSANRATFYGAWRISDSTFRDAEEATGEKIQSTKDIDRLEKQGVIRPITNPSRHRTFKDKK